MSTSKVIKKVITFDENGLSAAEKVIIKFWKKKLRIFFTLQ